MCLSYVKRVINTKRLRRELLETDGEVEIRREQDRIRTAKRRALETPAKQDKHNYYDYHNISILVIIVHILKVVHFLLIIKIIIQLMNQNTHQMLRVLHKNSFSH